jgi:hypothetical protein
MYSLSHRQASSQSGELQVDDMRMNGGTKKGSVEVWQTHQPVHQSERGHDLAKAQFRAKEGYAGSL